MTSSPRPARRHCSAGSADACRVHAELSWPHGMQAYESPLLVVVAAGAVALPTLVKLAGVMSSHSQVGPSCLEVCCFAPPSPRSRTVWTRHVLSRPASCSSVTASQSR